MQHLRITRWQWRLYVDAFPRPPQSRQTAPPRGQVVPSLRLCDR